MIAFWALVVYSTLNTRELNFVKPLITTYRILLESLRLDFNQHPTWIVQRTGPRPPVTQTVVVNTVKMSVVVMSRRMMVMTPVAFPSRMGRSLDRVLRFAEDFRKLQVIINACNEDALKIWNTTSSLGGMATCRQYLGRGIGFDDSMVVIDTALAILPTNR